MKSIKQLGSLLLVILPFIVLLYLLPYKPTLWLVALVASIIGLISIVLVDRWDHRI